MKKQIIAAGIAGTLLALGVSIAQAGAHRRQEVSIRYDTASGVPRHARESRDSNQYIGCSLRQFANAGIRTSCFARDASGRTIVCSGGWTDATTAKQADAISSIGPDSFVRFQLIDRTRCQTVYVENSSVYLNGPATLATAQPVGGLSW